MEKIVKQGILYDYYGSLLTERQQQIYEDAVSNDLSLSELASEYGISRQGIHDLLKRCDRILAGYEEKLGCIERDKKLRKAAEQILEKCSTQDSEDKKALTEQMLDLL
ncbi:MAG: DNA-binding protein [Lachnospiraceae bacterium]|nr:DNA-binding protein [Lachnospiraceae bacterium]